MSYHTIWPLFIFCAVLIGWGVVLFFFTDRLYDWQIRQLQSKRNRGFGRFAGIFAIAAGVLMAWANATGWLQ